MTQMFACLACLVLLQMPAAPRDLRLDDIRWTPRGPQATITCPLDAVSIPTTSAAQALVDSHAGWTTFCLKAGSHAVTSAITPKTGDTFVGEFGAILDGSGWQTSDTTQGAFRAHNQDIDDVTIRNLVIRNMPARGIQAYSSGWCADGACHFSTDGADRWTIENNELAFCKYGLNAPNDSMVRRNIIRNGVGDANSSLPAAYSAYLSHDVLFEDNEIADSGPQSKISLTRNVTFRNNYLHGNVDAIWYDGENTGSVIEGNLVEDTAHMGIFYEVSGQGVIRGNTVKRSADTGILVSSSHTVEVASNVLEDNWRGITYYIDCSRYHSPDGGWLGEPFEMRDVDAHDNTITAPATDWVLAGALALGSCDAASAQPYLNGSKHLTFTRNAYKVPSIGGLYWLWGAGYLSWSAWQTIQDTAGSVR